MTYRELACEYQKSLNYPIVRFKAVLETGKSLPPAGMVARLTFFGAEKTVGTMELPVKTWEDAPGSIKIEELDFSFSEFTANNAMFDTYDPGENSFPWLLSDCGKDGEFSVFPKGAQLDDDILWLEVLPETAVRAANKKEIAEAKRKNAEIIDELRKQLVEGMVEKPDPNDPCYIQIRDAACKIDDALKALADKLL